MRTLALAAVWSALAAGMAAGAGGASAQPSLRLVARGPLTVRGEHFVANERVRVVLKLPERAVRRVRANGKGAFRVVFRRVTLGSCGGEIVVLAHGSSGTLARLKLPARECLPA